MDNRRHVGLFSRPYLPAKGDVQRDVGKTTTRFRAKNMHERDEHSAVLNQPSLYTVQMGLVAPVSGATVAASFLPVYNSSAPVTTAATSHSGLAFYDNVDAVVAASRKRSRPVSFLGDDISSHLQLQQMLDVDRLILQHAERVQVELTERRKRFARQILATVEEGVAKSLKAREEEIARIGKLNSALEERIKSLLEENHMWQGLARSSEATAMVLRANLEQVVAAQVRVAEKEAEAEAEASTTPDDAESCCYAGNGEEEEEKTSARAEWRRVCRSCREREPSVLLLPCLHLCLCASCGPVVDACPVCNYSKKGSVSINMC
ncbi:probable BOI-related E3 ubiquitin-protein ligase 3 isoform X1 [Musa acuminata AAA Group]|uniref:probable BOI-related E3 ubiquitin-protein ligase 3 isoform X1 n=2 Tax=Musa acuminata AAA Group TaxID=214697 RepID=UPI0031D7EFD4